MDYDKHPTKKVYSWFSDKETIEIDEEIVDLVQLFWDEEFFTWNSCQDNFGDIWIEIDIVDFTHIVEMSYDHDDESELYDYLQTCDTKFQFSDDGYCDEKTNEWISGENQIYTVSLRFPKEDKDKFIKMWKDVFNPRNKAMISIMNDLTKKLENAIKESKEKEE